MVVIDQSLVTPFSECQDNFQVWVLAVCRLLCCRCALQSWSNMIQQIGVTDVTAGDSGF